MSGQHVAIDFIEACVCERPVEPAPERRCIAIECAAPWYEPGIQRRLHHNAADGIPSRPPLHRIIPRDPGAGGADAGVEPVQLSLGDFTVKPSRVGEALGPHAFPVGA